VFLMIQNIAFGGPCNANKLEKKKIVPCKSEIVSQMI